MTESPLIVATRQLLINRPRGITYKQIADEIGVSYQFIGTFAIKVGCQDFGTNKITRLYEYLSGKKLEVA